MTANQARVNTWRRLFGHPVSDKICIPSPEQQALCLRLIREEVDELEAAWKEGNLVEAGDALTDINFVVDGATACAGYHEIMDELGQEVFDSNMTKLGADGKPVYDEGGKVQKGPNYRRPDLKSIIERHIFQQK